MTNFEKRLEKAIERGKQQNAARAESEASRALSQRELRRLHDEYRLALSERIETCMQQVADHLPGFRYASVVGERGWGAALSRDDLELRAGRARSTVFSRLEIVVRPLSEAQLLELTVKGTIRNRELISRSQYQRLGEVQLDEFHAAIDRWALEFAELYAADE